MRGLLADRVAIVTGGGWNIGRAVAVAFARAGARVTVAGRDAKRLRATVELVEAAGGEALAVPTDVTDALQAERMVAATIERFGGVDALAALAGGGSADVPIDAVDSRTWEDVVRVNLFGTFQAVRVVLPLLRARAAGTIVTCAGGGALFPMEDAHATAYAAAKAGVCRLTDQLALEVRHEGMRVNCLLPGPTWDEERLRAVEAEERASGRPHPGRAMNRAPEEAAELALFLASEASAPLSGRIVSVDDEWWRDPERVRAVQADLHAYCLRRREPA